MDKRCPRCTELFRINRRNFYTDLSTYCIPCDRARGAEYRQRMRNDPVRSNDTMDVRVQTDFVREKVAEAMGLRIKRKTRRDEAYAIAKAALAFFDVPLGIAEIDREAVRTRVRNSGQRNWRQKGMAS